MSITFTSSSAPSSLIPSSIITKQNGQPVATTSAPVAIASSLRSMFTFLPVCSSIHIRPPPAPQQNDSGAVAGHLDHPGADRVDDRAGGDEHVVVAAQVAGVVEGDVSRRWHAV